MLQEADFRILQHCPGSEIGPCGAFLLAIRGPGCSGLLRAALCGVHGGLQMKKIVCLLLVVVSLAASSLEAEARTRRPLFPRLQARRASSNCSYGSCSNGTCVSGDCSVGALGSAEVPAAAVAAPPGPAATPEKSVATTKPTKELAAPPAP